MITVYVKTDIKKELPPVGAWVVIFTKDHGHIMAKWYPGQWKVLYSGGVSDIEVSDFVTHWLKEVEIDVDELKNVSENYSINYDEECSFCDGYNHILSLLNPTHNEP
jgi:hypothetical protein